MTDKGKNEKTDNEWAVVSDNESENAESRSETSSTSSESTEDDSRPSTPSGTPTIVVAPPAPNNGFPLTVTVLSRPERDVIFDNSGLGGGCNLDEKLGPIYTGLEVIDTSGTCAWLRDCRRHETKVHITASPHTATLLQRGWVDTAFPECPPWTENICIKERVESNLDHSSPLYAVGRDTYSLCMATFQRCGQPSASLKEDVEEALTLKDPEARSMQLSTVFGKYGHYYVDTVEMGGARIMSVSGQSTEQSIKAQVRADLNQVYNSRAEPRDNTLNSDVTTIGGSILADTFEEWKKSLKAHETWRPVRVISARATINLFDSETRSRIMAAMPQWSPSSNVDYAGATTPLYRLYKSENPDHFYTTSDVERKTALLRYGYQDEGVIGRVFPVQVDGTVPLYRLWIWGHNHIFTISDEERHDILGKGTDWNVSDEHCACYVFQDERPGTIPVYRFFNGSEHFYTTSEEEKDGASNNGYTFERIACYVLPP